MTQQLQQCLDEAHAFAHTLVPLEDNVSSNLQGACAIASAWLLCRLQEEGLDAEVVISHAHCYVRVHGLLMDPTATQFGMEPFIADRLPENCKCPWEYEEVMVADSLNGLLHLMENNGWPWDAERIYQYVVKGDM